MHTESILFVQYCHTTSTIRFSNRNRCLHPSTYDSEQPKGALFVMIGFAAQDGYGTVKLFDKEQPHHLMAECHTGERNLFARTVVDSLRETIWTANDKHQTACTGGTTTVNIPRKFHGTEFLATLIEQRYPVSIAEAAPSRSFCCSKLRDLAFLSSGMTSMLKGT